MNKTTLTIVILGFIVAVLWVVYLVLASIFTKSYLLGDNDTGKYIDPPVSTQMNLSVLDDLNKRAGNIKIPNSSFN